MISINDENFVSDFDPSSVVIGVIGHGYVGQAVDAYFCDEFCTLVYDKYPKDGEEKYLNSLEEVVRSSHIIFVCVPTPMEKDGRCHTGIIESVLDDIERTANDVGRLTTEFIVILKSTVNPGFTDAMKRSRPLRLMFSPEFLTEKNSILDFQNTNRIILGGDEEDALIVFKFFEKKIEGKADCFSCDAMVAEMSKLFVNAFLTTKVIFANEMYRVCEALGIRYDEVKLLGTLDPRIANSHLDVPGHDGDFGYGGHCFPKDIANLRRISHDLKTGERLFSATIDRNDDLRDKRDWEDMKGRAVVE